MKPAPIPENEQARVKALRDLNILDTPRETRFDRVTRLAQHLFNVPIALISLVEAERQWFKSCIGLPVQQTSREVSFCAHAILSDDVFVVEDTFKDRRFADNPLVTAEPYIRFYAGVPLVEKNGYRVGTICIIDNKPREFSAADTRALVDLAAIVMGELSAVDLAIKDELTQVYNRRGFELLAAQALKVSGRLQQKAALLYFDLDHFKQLNDTYGHAMGDSALKFFASCVKVIARDSDIFARVGGDEFILFMLDADAEDAKNCAKRLMAGLYEFNELPERLSYSVGISIFDPKSPRTLSELVASSDAAMYECKNAEKGNF